MKFERVLVSGQAGTMAAFNGNEVILFRQGEDEGRSVPPADLRLRFSSCTDLVEAHHLDQKEALDLLELEYRRDQSLHCLFLVLEAHKNPNRARAEAKTLNYWLDFELQSYLEETLYSRPLPDSVDFRAVEKAITGFDQLEQFWQDLTAFQDRISTMHQHFKTALGSGDSSDRRRIYSGAVQSAFFRGFVRGHRMNVLEANLRSGLSDVPASGEFVRRFLTSLLGPDETDFGEASVRAKRTASHQSLHEPELSGVEKRSGLVPAKVRARRPAVDRSNSDELPAFSMKALLEAGAHFGHQTHRWNPKMKPYIFGERNGVHIIDLSQTVPLFARALDFVRQTVAAGGKVLFVGTKRQAQEPIAEAARASGQYYVNHRWLGGMLTSWKTISNSIKRFKSLEEQLAGDTTGLTKKEVLQLTRERDKLELSLGGIRDMGGIPDVMFVIDANKEELAIKEANVLGIPVVAILDSNVSPQGIAFPVPGNDDASRAIRLYCAWVAQAANDARAGVVARGTNVVDFADPIDFPDFAFSRDR